MAFASTERRRDYEQARASGSEAEMAAYRNRWATIKIGTRNGKLTILHRPGGRTLFCVCDCGNFKTARSGNFTRTASCGCDLQTRFEDQQFTTQITALVTIYESNARGRGRAFELSRDEFTALALGDCYYCGSPPSSFIKTKRDKRLGRPGLAYNGIDRESQDLGYVLANCRTCCSTCNYAKGTMSAEAYFAHCSRVANWALTATRSVFD